MKITLGQLRSIVREAAEVEFANSSPLTYTRAGGVKRIALVDSSVEPPKKHDTYFSQTSRYVMTGPSGRKLKKPRQVTEPGAAPGTVAFLDYHMWGPDCVYIDYMKTRQDMRGQGHARRLVDELVKKYGEDKLYHFGRIMNPSAGKIQRELAARLQAAGKGGSVAGYHDY